MRFIRFSFALLLMAAFAGQARADNLAPACTANTLAFYMRSVNSDSPCSVGILNFENFSFNSAGSATLDTPSDIEVTPDGVGGFIFTQVTAPDQLIPPPFSVAAGSNAIYDIGYDFIIDSGPDADAASLGMDPPAGNVSIDEFFCADAGFSQDGASATPFCSATRPFSPQDLHVDDTNPPISWFTGVVALNPPAFVDGSILTQIELDGGTSGAQFDRALETTFTHDPSAPEPSTIALVLAGLGGIGVCRRRSRLFRDRREPS